MQLYEWRFRKSMEGLTQASRSEAIPDISLSKNRRVAVWGPCIASNHPWLRKFLKRLEAIVYRFPRTTTRWSRDSAQSEHPDGLEGCKLTVDRLPPLF